jgi:RNA polymerase sigma-70 factor (ECF subfamily)
MSVDPLEHASVECSGRTFDQLCELPDSELMAHLRAGHGEALAVLFDRFHRLVLSVAYRILGDIGEAEDIVQAVFLEIYRRASQYDSARGTAKIWVLQHAYLRSMTRRQYLKSRRFYDSAAISHEVQPESIGRELRNGVLAFPEMRILLRQGFGTLTTRQQRTLQLAYYEGMSLREIAEETGESLGNVRHHYYRGLRQLRSMLSVGNGDNGNEGNGKPRSAALRGGIVDVEA